MCRENCKYALDERFHGHFCPRRKPAKSCHPASHVVCGSSLQSMIVIQSISIASQWDCSGTAPMWTQSRTPGRRQWGRRATLWGRERTRGSHLCHYSLLWHHHYWKEHHQLVWYPARWSFSFTLGPLHWISNIQSGFQRTLNYSAVITVLIMY